MSEVIVIGGLHHLIYKDMVRELMKMNDVKAAESFGLLVEVVKSASEAEIDMIIDLIKQIK